MSSTRAAALAALLALCNCSWLVKHPPAAAAVAGVTLGFTSCEIDNGPVGTCAAIGGIAGAALGGIALLVTVLADTGQHAQPPPEQQQQRPRFRVLPPPPIDAGIADAALVDAAPAPLDAPAPALDAAPADGG